MARGSTTDRRGRLEQAPFAYRVHKDGHVVISWQGRPVTSLRGHAARRFVKKVTGASDEQAQLVMAKVTGNFKRGNERDGKQ